MTYRVTSCVKPKVVHVQQVRLASGSLCSFDPILDAQTVSQGKGVHCRRLICSLLKYPPLLARRKMGFTISVTS